MPAQVCRRHLRAGIGIRALVVNSGIANAGTDSRGHVLKTCATAARLPGCRRDHAAPFSAGMISGQLPVECFGDALALCVPGLGRRNWMRAARAVMATDAVPKGISRTVPLGSGKATVTGIAKGAGMIHPNMATMLACLVTDANIPSRRLDAVLREAVSSMLNTVSVDSDTSTSDSVAGKADTSPVTLVEAMAVSNRARQERLTAKTVGLVLDVPDPVLDPARTLGA